MDTHLCRFQPRGLRGIGLVHGLELISRPDLATIGGELDDRIERLHRRVREVGELVAGRYLPRRVKDCGGTITLLACRQCGLIGKLPIFSHQSRAAELLGAGIVPIHLERVPPPFGGPEAFGHDRYAMWHLYHLDHARYGTGRTGVERSDLRTEQGWALEQCHEHARQRDIQGELCRPVDLRRDVDPRWAAADQFVVLGLLEADRRRNRQGCGLTHQ